jgi:hypothetical protein
VQRALPTSLLLVTLAFRALIPAGFMPSGHGPLSMTICHAGMPTPMGTSTHPDRSSHFDHCPFGTAPAAGPLSSIAAIQPAVVSAACIACDFVSLRAVYRLDPAHAPRAPPTTA